MAPSLAVVGRGSQASPRGLRGHLVEQIPGHPEGSVDCGHGWRIDGVKSSEGIQPPENHRQYCPSGRGGEGRIGKMFGFLYTGSS